MVDFIRKKLKPGKNIIEFNNIILDNTINQSVKISLNLSNSKDSANHISFVRYSSSRCTDQGIKSGHRGSCIRYL